MPQSQIVDPKEVRSAGSIKLGEIPINAYSATPKEEVKRYGAERLQRVLYDMLTIREFETALNDIKMQNSYRDIEYNHKGPAHLSIGQESTAVGTCLELDVEDFIFGSHRSHGEILAKCYSAIARLDDGALETIMKGYLGGDVLAIAEQKLAPGGLFLVSYNAMPGWAHLQPIKGILQQYAALRTGDSHQRIRDALAYLVFIRDKQAKYFEDNPRAAAYVDALLKQDISYLAHEYLNEHWTTFYFAEVAAAFRGAGLQFAGSLPIHTNFWDLCVKPEFQELFRTTSDRLVAEAHKDFCANTAFRWDIYAKGPRPLATAEDRLREVDDLCYGLVRRDLTLPYRANLGVVTSTVQGPLYQAFIEALQDGSRHLSELLPAVAHAAGGADRKPEEVIRAADAGVAMGMFEVTSGPVPVAAAEAPAAVAVPQPFNRLVLETGALAGRPVALASTCTGSGLQIGDLEAAMLLELSERGREGLTDRVVTRLVASKRNLQKDGQPVTDEATRNQIVEQACQVFLRGRVPQLVATAVAAPA